MNSPLVQCPRCRSALPDTVFNQPEYVPCPGCGTPLLVQVYPALFRPAATGRSGEPVLVDDESSCFYHPAKKAVVPCDSCGRFLCALCDCELHGKHFCPGCLEAGKTKGSIRNLENRRTLYDSIALSLSVLPVATFFLTVVTAPMALFLAVRYWNAPLSLVRRTRIRFVFAIVFAGAQTIGWAVAAYFLFSSMFS